jgi:uncharacterized protein YndB with AHSA1/START domain
LSTEEMAGERIEIELEAPPARVYAAIATGEGVRAWWSEGVVAEEVGGTSRLEFGASGWTELRVDRLDPDREVAWSCVAQDIANFDPRDEWVGTTIRFRLSPLGDGTRTKLDFAHEGLAGLGCEEMCTRGWSHYIGTSLKGLVERDEGAAGPGAGSRR